MSGTITGTYHTLDGGPAEGVAEVIPSVPVVKDADGKVILSGRMKVTLDGTGSFDTGEIPDSEDASLDPVGVTYTVVAKLRHAHLKAVTGIFIPAGGTVDVFDETDPDPAAPSYAERVNDAETAATAAAASQTAAASSAAAASTSATAAAGSATAADTSADAAAVSATTADGSAAAAVVSASAADASADAAATSVTAAQTARTGAETARDAAQTSATAAAQSATEADASADAAAVSATSAGSDATVADRITSGALTQAAFDTRVGTSAPVRSVAGLIGTPTAQSVVDAVATPFDARVATLSEPLTVSGKRAVRKDELVFNVKDFGAVGNGTTDDTAAINSAATAARAVPGSRVLLPPATYMISFALLVHGVTVVGYGATVKHKAAVTAFNMLRMNDVTGATVLGLTFDGNSANTTDSGNDAVGVGFIANPASWTTPVVLRDCTFQNFHRPAVHIAPTNSATDPVNAPASATVIDNCTMAAARYGVYANRVTDLQVKGCRITTPNQSGIFVNLCNRPNIAGNYVSGATVQHGIVTLYCRDQVIAHNTCVSNTQIGIAVGGGSTTNTESRNAILTGNVCRSNGQHGISLDTTKTGAGATTVPLYATLTGNVCEANTLHGIYAKNSSNLTITGNLCRSNLGDGIALSCADTVVTGNHCRGNTVKAIGMYGNASFPNYGRHRLGVNYVAGNGGGYFVEGASVTDVAWASLTTTNPAA